MEYSFPVIDGMDIATAIQTISCSADDYYDILKTYYRTLNLKVAEIRQAYETMDIPNYTIYVHALKSSSRAVGAYVLGDMAYELELAGKAGDIDTIRQKTSILLDYIDTLYNNLSPVFETDDCADNITEEELTYILTELKEYMNNNDIIMVNNSIEELESYCVNDTLTELITSITNLSFQMEYGQCIEIIDNYLN